MLLPDGRLVNHHPFSVSRNMDIQEVSLVETIFPPLPSLQPGETCRPYVTYREGCNVCRCSQHHELHCTQMTCLDDGPNSRKNMAEGDDFDPMREKRDSDPAEPCTPGSIIRRGCQRCFCNELGQTNKCNYDACRNTTKSNAVAAKRRILTPEDIRSPFAEEEFRKLPALHHYSAECTPGAAYRLDCNTCLCKEDKNLLCGQYLCLKHDFYHKKQAEVLSGTSCSNLSNITSECVKCSCQDDVLVCKPLPDCVEDVYRAPKALRQGVASKNSNKPETAVDPYKEKCVPGMIYKVHCNSCKCQENGIAFCTMKKCLNYEESLELSRDIERLKELERRDREAAAAADDDD